LNQAKIDKEEEMMGEEKERKPKLAALSLEKNEPWDIPTFLRKKKK